jgi:hypothetical protein
VSGYTLPDGSTTTNDVQYVREWQSIAHRIERALGVTVISSNPGFQIADKDGAVTSVPMWLVRKIIGITKERDEAQRLHCVEITRESMNPKRFTPEWAAKQLGWDCFAQEGGGA